MPMKPLTADGEAFALISYRLEQLEERLEKLDENLTTKFDSTLVALNSATLNLKLMEARLQLVESAATNFSKLEKQVWDNSSIIKYTLVPSSLTGAGAAIIIELIKNLGGHLWP